MAIFSYDGYNNSDLQQYYNTIGMKSNVYIQNVLVNGYSGNCTGINGNGPCQDGEQVLDIANVAGMAPGLDEILFYEGTSSTTILNQIANDNIAKVISSSWSGGDFGNASENAFKQMQAEGITYVNASEDYGAYSSGVICQNMSGSYCPPALSPSIIQVGGTDLNTTGPGGSYISETAWQDSGGGWISNTFGFPSFQQNAINSTNRGPTG
ncbi:MAG: S8/S53 family peptidase [Acidobacteriaceae bacterium]